MSEVVLLDSDNDIEIIIPKQKQYQQEQEQEQKSVTHFTDDTLSSEDDFGIDAALGLPKWNLAKRNIHTQQKQKQKEGEKEMVECSSDAPSNTVIELIDDDIVTKKNIDYIDLDDEISFTLKPIKRNSFSNLPNSSPRLDPLNINISFNDNTSNILLTNKIDTSNVSDVYEVTNDKFSSCSKITLEKPKRPISILETVNPVSKQSRVTPIKANPTNQRMQISSEITDSSPIITLMPVSAKNYIKETSKNNQNTENIANLSLLSHSSPTLRRTMTLPSVISKNKSTLFNKESVNRRKRERSSSLSDSLVSNTVFDEKITETQVLSKEGAQNYANILKKKKKTESKRIRQIASDLQTLRNNKSVTSNPKYTKSVNDSLKNVTSLVQSESSEVSNISISFDKPTTNFMDKINDELMTYTDDQLEIMLERAKLLEPQKVKKVNQQKRTREEIVGKITCCFSSSLKNLLEDLSPDFEDIIKNEMKFEFMDERLPLIRFKRLVDCVLYDKKSTFVPITERFVFEDYSILLYHSKDLLEILQTGGFKRGINSIKSKNPNMKISVWIIGYEDYLKKLKIKADNKLRKKLRKQLDAEHETASNDNNKKKHKKGKEDDEIDVTDTDIKEKMLRYEINLDFSFQSIKGLKDMMEWLVSSAYTLSCKHTDFLERTNSVSNIGKVKSSDNAKDCLILMLTQFKGMTEVRAKKFINQEKISSIGELYRKALNSSVLTETNILRNDHEKLIRKTLLSRNEDDIL